MAGIFSRGQLETCTVEPVIVITHPCGAPLMRLRAAYADAAARTAKKKYGQSEGEDDEWGNVGSS